MPMNEEVRKIVDRLTDNVYDTHCVAHKNAQTIRAELTRLTEIADGVDPLVVRLGEVTTKLEAANARVELLTIGNLSYAQDNANLLGRESVALKRLDAANALLREISDRTASGTDFHDLAVRIRAHLSEPRT